MLLLQDWTKSVAQLRRALRRLTPGMFTRFHDAMLLASRDQLPRSSARHAIIVLTDGIDSGRGASFEIAFRAALQSQTTIYVVSNTEIERAKKQHELVSFLSGSSASIKFNDLHIQDLRMGLDVLAGSEQNLDQLTAATGGRLYRPSSFSELLAYESEPRRKVSPGQSGNRSPLPESIGSDRLLSVPKVIFVKESPKCYTLFQLGLGVA